MDFDEVLSQVGDLGRYQRWLFVLLCVPAGLPSVASIFSHIFVSAVPKHRCHAPVTAQKTLLLRKSLAESEDYDEALYSLLIPRDAQRRFLPCHQYDIDVNAAIDEVVAQSEVVNSTIIDGFVAKNQRPLIQCVNGWDYDRTLYPETLASKLNVVCDRRWLISTAQSAFFIGGTIGCLVFGWISDKWGRRPAFFIATALMITGSLAEISPPSYFAYIFMRFIVGLSYPSVYNLAFLIVAEMTGPRKRTSSAMVCSISFSLGIVLFAYVAYFVNHWQTLQTVISLPMLLLIGYFWLVPESPRWLLSQGRVDEAEIIVQKMAQVNGVSIPPDFLRRKLEKCEKTTASSNKQLSTGIEILHFLKYRKVTRRIILIAAIWTLTAMVYNGISFGMPDLSSEAHIAFFLSGVAEIPGTLFAWYAMEVYGRRSTMLLSLFLGGIASMATAFVPEGLSWLATLLPLFAKSCISATFTVVLLYAGELFPTVVRGLAISVASTASQMGLVVTPYILFLGTLYGKTVPFVILGAFSLTAALLMLLLPETLDAPLPNTMEDAEDYQEFVAAKKAMESMQPVVEKAEAFAAPVKINVER